MVQDQHGLLSYVSLSSPVHKVLMTSNCDLLLSLQGQKFALYSFASEATKPIFITYHNLLKQFGSGEQNGCQAWNREMWNAFSSVTTDEFQPSFKGVFHLLCYHWGISTKLHRIVSWEVFDQSISTVPFGHAKWPPELKRGKKFSNDIRSVTSGSIFNHNSQEYFFYCPLPKLF